MAIQRHGFRDKNGNGIDDATEPVRGFTPNRGSGIPTRNKPASPFQSAAQRRIFKNVQAKTTSKTSQGSVISQLRNKGQQGTTMSDKSSRLAQLANLQKNKGRGRVSS